MKKDDVSLFSFRISVFFFHCRETFHLQVYKCLASVSYGWVPRSVISGSKGVCVRVSETGDILRLYLY